MSLPCVSAPLSSTQSAPGLSLSVRVFRVGRPLGLQRLLVVLGLKPSKRKVFGPVEAVGSGVKACTALRPSGAPKPLSWM